MTADYWEHVHSVAPGCELGEHSRDLHDSTAAGGLRPGTDNGTYEATLFGDRAVHVIGNHTMQATAGLPAQPFFMYLAFLRPVLSPQVLFFLSDKMENAQHVGRSPATAGL